MAGFSFASRDCGASAFAFEYLKMLRGRQVVAIHAME
jgi:hypothetical protein